MRMDQQIHEGINVLDRNGEKIGKCGETLGQFFNVDAGFLGTKEYYVPFDAITEIQENSIFLNVGKHDIDGLGWNKRPEERGYATGTATTGTTGRTGTTDTTGGATTTQSDSMRLREEQLQARREPVETGRVQVGKEVVHEQRSVDVPVSREEAVVERRPVDRRPADQPIGTNADRTIDVPVREEQVDVEKKPVVYEEVGVGKRATQSSQQVSDTVRREEPRIDKEGDIDVRHNEPGNR